MNRRDFNLLGISTAAVTLMRSASGQATQAPSPDNLAKALPSPNPGPGRCSELPELPSPPSDAVTQELFPGFKSQYVKTSGATIRVLTKGDGPPLLLLHGHPETHVTWHKVAPKLAAQYSVVVPDLRGYGDSSKPAYSEDHSNYSFRAMAQDNVEVMQQLGHTEFLLAGHDRGARCAHRLCLDHPEAVRKVVFMDIAPMRTMYNDTNKEFATKYLWWFLQIQPSPCPNTLSASIRCTTCAIICLSKARPAARSRRRPWPSTSAATAAKEPFGLFAKIIGRPPGIDLDMDRADDAILKTIRAPVLALWGAKGTVGDLYDVIATWKPKAAGPVTGKALPCGHLLPEEAPEDVLAALQTFFNA